MVIGTCPHRPGLVAKRAQGMDWAVSGEDQTTTLGLAVDRHPLEPLVVDRCAHSLKPVGEVLGQVHAIELAEQALQGRLARRHSVRKAEVSLAVR